MALERRTPAAINEAKTEALTRLDALEALNTSASVKIDAISSEVESSKKTWANIVAQNDSQAKGTISVPAPLRSMIHQVKDDQVEAEKRQNNLIVFNLIEVDAQTDLTEVKDIFSICEVPLADDDIVSLDRRGKKPASASERPRPLIIKMAANEKKKKLLTSLEKFRAHQLSQRPAGDDGSREDQHPMVRVDHDMTQAQRELRKELLAKARQDSLSGPRKFVVRGPPWEMRIVSLPKTKETQAANHRIPATGATKPQAPQLPAQATNGVRPKLLPQTRPLMATAPNWFLNPPASPPKGATA